MRNLPFFLLTASLALSACKTLPAAPPQLTKPSLDQYLANDCKPIGPVPNTDNFDAILNWVTDTVFVNYGDCAIRHHQTVAAWPK